ncbi:conserved hypothetical protein [Culex quinquefasciatus]|uniref:ZAD domain-containing protein n=1 Tax=Culex quinquefasciatus TaxID=7176 RepID=B0X7K8_CULQU|nr:conserved hypothetical protein [Culex quinquefasciatus]|eukprot:XP_001865630.1 conserved hypothetical protein [Culex quinquefasciatus]
MEPHNVENRTNEMRTAKMCRLCLSSGNRVLIATDHNLRALLGPSYESFLPEDGDLPQLVCEQCFRTIGILWEFAVRGNVSADLMRSYIADEGPYPTVEIRKNRIERMENRPVSPEKIVALGKSGGARRDVKSEEVKVGKRIKTECLKSDKVKNKPKEDDNVAKKKVKKEPLETTDELFGSCDVIPRKPVDKKPACQKIK